MLDHRQRQSKSYTFEISKPDPVTRSSRAAICGPIAANIAFVLELTLVPLLLPAIRSQFGLSISDLAWVFNSYGVAVALGVLVGGWCGDVFNTRKVFNCGVAFFAAGSLVAAAATSFETLIIGRILQGFGGGVFSPLVPLLLTRASPRKPGRILILWGSIAGYVAAFAPLIFGSFLNGYSWNVAFIFIAIIAAIALLILIGSQVVDDPAPSSRQKTDYSEIFRAPDLWLTFVYVFCTYGSITYFLFRLPVWLSGNEVDTTSIGLVLSTVWLTFSALSALLRNMVDRHHIQTIMLAAPVLIATGLLLSYEDQNLPVLIISSVLVGAGLACSNAPSTQLILKFAPDGMSAVSTSLDITFARLGGIATVAIFAQTEGAYSGLAMCVLCLLAAVCARKISKQFANGF